MPVGSPLPAPVVSTVAAAAEAVAAAPARLGRSRLVCVDGRAGAGKTTFADALADRLRRAHAREVTVVHLDDLYEGWAGLPGMAGRLSRELVGPLRSGQPGLVRRWDWQRDGWGGWLEVRPPDVLILDGVGCYARSFDEHVSLLVWLEADAAVRRRRAMMRDGDALAGRWDAWAADEQRVLSRERTRDRADYVVNTDTGPLGA